MSNKKIGIIHLYGYGFPPEIRIEKHYPVFKKLGFTNVVLSTFKNNSEKEYEEYKEDFYIKRIVKKTKTVLQKLLGYMTLLSPEYEKDIEEFIKTEKPNVLIVHDIYHLRSVLKVAKRYKLPVIADLHENMPAALVAYRSNDSFIKKLIKATLFNYKLWQWHESNMLKKCDLTLVMCEEAKERFVKYGLDMDKVIVVSNTEDETTFTYDPSSADKEIVTKYVNNFMISYVGNTGPHRGIDTTIKSLKYIKNQISNLKLVIVGLKGKEREIITNWCKEEDVFDMVEIIDWVPFDKVNSYIVASDVCLVPHNDFEHTHTTVPHKLFQYMICEKPILVSDCKPLKKIIEETNSGVVFKASNPKNMADKILYMYKNKESIKVFGINGKKAALGIYAWKHDAKRLEDAVKKLFITLEQK